MTDNNNTNTTTTGVYNTSAQSNTTPKRLTNNNTTASGVDNTTTAPTAATANNNTNDNVEHNSTHNSPQPFTPGKLNNNNADKTNNTNNFTPADVNAVSSSPSTTTPTSVLKPTILQYTSKSNYKLPSLGDRKVGVSGGSVNKRRAVLGHKGPTSSLEVIKQENKNLSIQNKKMSMEIEKLNHINSLSQINLSTTKSQLESAMEQEHTTSVLLDHARQQLEQSEGFISHLHNTIENNQGSVASLIQQFESLSATVTNANANALGERDNALRERDSLITELQGKVGIMEALCVNLEKELKVKDAELESGIDGAIDQVTQRTVAQVKLEKERDAREKEHALMDKERKQSASTIAELEAQVATLSVESTVDKDRVAAAPLRTEEDDNGDDKMAVEERTSAESKEKLAVSDVEMKEANEPANKSKSDAEISKWEEKINEFRQALASSQLPAEKKVLRQNIAECINILGKVRLENGRIKEAAEDFQRVLDIPDATYSTTMNAIMNHAKANHISHIQQKPRLAPLQLPANIRKYCDNDTFHKASSELGSAGPLIADAEKSNRNFGAWDCKAEGAPDSLREQVAASPSDDAVTPPEVQQSMEQAITQEPTKIVVALFHYISNSKFDLHVHGSLYSGGLLCHPFSPTSGPFIELWTNSLAHVFQFDIQNALPFSMNQIVWGDIFNLDGGPDEATNAKTRAAFEKLVEETEENNLEFVLENIKLLGDDTEVFMIIFSNASWKFYQKYKSKFPSNVKVIQDRSLVHTCLMSQTIGITERQAFTLVDATIKTQSLMLGVDTPEVDGELVRKVIGPGRINSRKCDKYVYVGRYNRVIILVGGGCVAFRQLLEDEGAPTTDFPNQATILSNMENGTATEHAGLELEIHPFDSDEVVSLQTGPQDDVHKSEYDQWYKCSEKRQGYTGDRMISSRDTTVYVAIYNKKIIFYSPNGVKELKRMIRKEGATFGESIFPTETELKKGQGNEIVELNIKMYASNSAEAAKFKDTMKPGPQKSDEFEEWKDKNITNAKLILHSVKPGTIEVASWFDEPITSLRQFTDGEKDVIKKSGIKIANTSQSNLNSDLGKVGLQIGYVRGSKKPSWDNVREAKKSIEGKKAILVWFNVYEDTDGAVPKKGQGVPKNTFHAPFILSGLQLEPGHEASVVLDKKGIEVLDKNDTEVTKEVRRRRTLG